MVVEGEVVGGREFLLTTHYTLSTLPYFSSVTMRIEVRCQEDNDHGGSMSGVEGVGTKDLTTPP